MDRKVYDKERPARTSTSAAVSQIEVDVVGEASEGNVMERMRVLWEIV